MLVLDSTVLIAALDRSRASHQSVREILSSERHKAVTTQTMREALTVATRPRSANGLEIDFPSAWKSLGMMRMACDRLLFENDTWWLAYAELAQAIQPSGRSIYDLGQVAFVRCLGRNAMLLTDDGRLVERYKAHIAAVTVAELIAG